MTASPPPIEPLPVIPIYDPPAAIRRKPAIITTLGITAIVIAALSLTASFVTGMIALGMMIQTQVSKTLSATTSTRVTSSGGGNINITTKVNKGAAPATAPATAAAAAPTAAPKFPVGPRGLDAARRSMVSDALNRWERLSPAQAERVDQLLAKAGKDIFPFGIGENTMKSAVSDSGTLRSGSSVANYYLLASGKLEIYDDRAIFFPTDGQPLRVRADDPPDIDGSNALRADTIDALIKSAQAQTGNKLTPQQVATLKSELSDPEQTLVIENGFNAPALYASVLPDTSVNIRSNGFVIIDPAGNVSNSTTAIFANATKFAVRGSASTMTLLDALFSTALGIYLLVVGILVLKQNRRGRGLQMVFAILKVPIAILAAIGWAWTIEDVNANAISGAMSGAQLQFWLWTFIVIGMAYPIGLLCVLQLRSVKEYYAGALR